MADTPWAATLARAHWAGTDADLDIHLEAYEGDIEGTLRAESLFRSAGLTTYKSLQNTNTWRGDRVGGAKVKGRRAGEALDSTRIVNEKMTITVDTTSYIRTPIDYQDDWTSPDFRSEYSAEHGSAHAKTFDQAHLIQLIKAGEWVAPASLKTNGGWYDGIRKTLTGFNAATSNADKADIIVQKHKDVLAEFVKRDLGGSLGEFVTLIEPDLFNILLDHDKLMNVQFSGGGATGNSFAQRRIAILNGIRIIETPRFPTAAITDHPLGPDFNVTAEQAKARLVLFHPRKTLVTVEAQGMTTRIWDDKANFANVLESYTLYTVGIKRGDATAVLALE